MSSAVVIGVFTVIMAGLSIATVWIGFILRGIQRNQDKHETKTSDSHGKLWESLNKAHNNHGDFREYVADNYAKQKDVDEKLTSVLEKIGDRLAHNIELMTHRLDRVERHIDNSEKTVQVVNRTLPSMLQTLNDVNKLILEMNHVKGSKL